MTKQLNLTTIRQNLTAERFRLIERIAGEAERLRQPIGLTPESVDRARLSTAYGLQSTLLAQTQHYLEQVEAALQRLDEGTYGVCSICDQPINPERLSAVPHAITCIRCQTQKEQQ